MNKSLSAKNIKLFVSDFDGIFTDGMLEPPKKSAIEILWQYR